MEISEKPRAMEALLLCRSNEGKAVRQLLDRISDKWSILVIVILSRSENYRCRFSEIQRNVSGISQRMLTTTLRHLERDGYIIREVFPEVPPRVEYELTELGISLLVPLHGLVNWLEVNQQEITESRNKFDSKNEIK